MGKITGKQLIEDIDNSVAERTKEIETGNKIIIESCFVPDDVKINFNHYKDSGNDIGLNIYIKSLRFHTDWNYLMAVVEKIEKYKYEDNDGTDRDYNFAYLRTFQGHMVRINRFPLTFGETKIEALWFAVIRFIKWFNENKK